MVQKQYTSVGEIPREAPSKLKCDDINFSSNTAPLHEAEENAAGHIRGRKQTARTPSNSTASTSPQAVFASGSRLHHNVRRVLAAHRLARPKGRCIVRYEDFTPTTLSAGLRKEYQNHACSATNRRPLTFTSSPSFLTNSFGASADLAPSSP